MNLLSLTYKQCLLDHSCIVYQVRPIELQDEEEFTPFANLVGYQIG